MKPLILALLLLFLPLVGSGQSLKTKYDKFRDETTVYAGPDYVEMGARPVEVAVYVGYKGQTAAREGMIIGLAVYSSSSEWRFLDNDSLIVLADGKRLDIGKPISKDSKIDRRGGVDESLAYKISESDLVTMSRATKVEMQIGHVEFSLRSKFMQKLREISETLPR